jgi:hypothetical protein
VRFAGTVRPLLALGLLLSLATMATADQYRLMRMFYDLSMSKSRIRNDGVRAEADAMRAMAQANMSNATAEVERMRARSLSIEGDRQSAQVSQMKRDLRLHNRVDMQARKETEALLERKTQLTSFFSGRVTPSNSRAFLWSSTRVPYSESFRGYLSRQVQPISGDQFKSSMPIFVVLSPTGELRRPPICLMGRRGTEIYERRQEFEEIWQRLVNAMRYDHDLDYDHFLAVEDRMTRWRKCCDQREVSAAARRGGKVYLDRLHNVVHCMETQNGFDRLTALVKNEGFGFPGGNCGQLLEHIQDWSLQVRPGSEAQLLLAEFGEACLGSIADEIKLAQNDVKPAMMIDQPLAR